MNIIKLKFSALAFILMVSCFIQPLFGQNKNKKQNANLNTYLRAVELQASPEKVDSIGKYFQFRIVITENEIYKSLWAECLEISGVEGSNIYLKYSIRLDADKFKGNYQPGYEGVDIHFLYWIDHRNVVCKIGPEDYKITFSTDPKNILVNFYNK